MYHDGGSGWFHTFNNVVSKSSGAVWLLINGYNVPRDAHGHFQPKNGFDLDFQPTVRVFDTFVDNVTFCYEGKVPCSPSTIIGCKLHSAANCTATNTTVVDATAGQPWPTAAHVVMVAAGPRNNQVYSGAGT